MSVPEINHSATVMCGPGRTRAAQPGMIVEISRKIVGKIIIKKSNTLEVTAEAFPCGGHGWDVA